MVKKNNNAITLDELASMVSGGFDNIEKRMVTKDEFNDFRFDVNKRLGKLEFQVDEMHDILKRFEENDILNLQKRVQILEKAVRALATSQTSK